MTEGVGGVATHRACLSLGSNIDAASNLASALRALRHRFGDVRVSPVYRTPAVGFDGDDFLNLAAIVTTDLDAPALNDWLHALEDAHGRRRDQPRFSARTLDIDIVFFDDLILSGPGNLQIPRPELRHAFVLKPLADLVPGFVVPGTDDSLAELWARHADRGVAIWNAGTTL
jgi:2-amino-4-hydroxy-6-hydroxymethyldihydropteridine diphosphokinase